MNTEEPVVADAHPPAPGARIDVRAVRHDFPAVRNSVWFQNGVVSLTPRRVAEFHIGLMREILERGPMHVTHKEEETQRRRDSKGYIAQFLGARVEDTALMRGVSESFLTIIRGIDWQPGDEIILTEDEEAALLLPCLQLRDVHGVVLRRFPLSEDPSAQLDAFRRCLSSRTRLIAVSHVTTDLGFRLPIDAICEAAREMGALSFVDFAHSAGLLPIDLGRSSCDFAGVISYKWMYGPYASGLLHIKPSAADRVRLRYAGGRAQQWMDASSGAYELRAGAERFEFGPWSWPLVHAWAEALRFLDDVGTSAIWDRTSELVHRLKTGLLTVPGAVLLTPAHMDGSAALVSFTLNNWPAEELVEELRKRWNIAIKAIHGRMAAVRASIAFFLLEEEVDLLVDACQALAAERR